MQISIKPIDINHDLKSLCTIEAESFKEPWTDSDFLDIIDEQCIIVIALMDGQPVGYAFFHDVISGSLSILRLINIAVIPKYRRSKIGTQLITKIVELTSCSAILADIRESNLGVQLFLKSLNFKVTRDGIIHNAYSLDDKYEDVYRFNWIS